MGCSFFAPMIVFFLPNSRGFFAHFLYKLPRWVSFRPDGVSFFTEYHHQPLFFIQPSETPFWEMYLHKTPPKPTPKHPFSWPELESGPNELLSGQNGPQLGKRKVGKTVLEVGKKKSFISPPWRLLCCPHRHASRWLWWLPPPHALQSLPPRRAKAASTAGV